MRGRGEWLTGEVKGDELCVGSAKENAVTVETCNDACRHQFVVDNGQAKVTVIKEKVVAKSRDIDIDNDREVIRLDERISTQSVAQRNAKLPSRFTGRSVCGSA